MKQIKKLGSILITGGTGSLGTRLVNDLVGTNLTYDKIIIYSRNEHAQENLYNLLSPLDHSKRLRFLIGDIRDSRRLAMALSHNNVHTIINTAALKVVPKGENDPIEFVHTNITGVENIIEAAIKYDIKKVMQISTDKAVMPVNLYGATKLTAEKLILAANNIRGAKGPSFGFVRYGNVASSKGSVIPYFMDLWRKGLPFNVTNLNMTRFWITLEESSKFVLNSVDNLYKHNNMFIPKMSAYVVKDLCEAIGGRGYKKIIIGVRPGEKMHESILTPEEYSRFPGYIQNSNQVYLYNVKELRQLLIENCGLEEFNIKILNKVMVGKLYNTNGVLRDNVNA